MDGPCSRRQLLRTGIAAGAVGLAGCRTAGRRAGDDPPVDVRGAIYIPTRAFTHYQTWSRYDPGVIERDLGYAARVNLNALRVTASYEFWRDDPGAHEEAFEHFLSTAAANGIEVLIGLFDAVGANPWRELLTRDDVATAVPTASPHLKIVEDRDRWDEPREFVRWFMDRYRDDDRLLSIEINNEPGWEDSEKRFTRGMLRTALDERGTVPLSVGSTSLINCVDYVEWGADALQFHYNFPRSPRQFRSLMDDGVALAERLDRPVWLTEWQRVRTSGGGFLGAIEGDEWQPKYRSLAPILRETGVGNFFWTLMVQPAWELAQREKGTVNGLFHEDGAVWNREDARAIKAMSGDPAFDAEERPERPDWMTMDKILKDDGDDGDGEGKEEG